MSDRGIHPADERHEERDVDRRKLLVFSLLFALFIAVSVGLLWLIFGVREGGFAAAQLREILPLDGELDQRRQLQTYLAGQHERLEALRWTDGTKAFAKVPIEDAMALLAAQGGARAFEGAPGADCPFLQGEVPRAAAAQNCGAAP